MSVIDSSKLAPADSAYRICLAATDAQVAQAGRLRAICFMPERAAQDAHLRDTDPFDASCQHLLVHRSGADTPCAAMRFWQHPTGRDLQSGYSGQFYGLSSLDQITAPVIELGRLCVAPNAQDPGILRAILAWLAGMVQDCGAALLCGCASFKGTDPAPFQDSLAYLAQHHLAPAALSPAAIAPHILSLPDTPFDPRRAMAQMPPLLRAYLGLGGWVSDHAVIDHDLNTMHVFTGVEIARIPPARKRSLLAGRAQ